MFTRSDYRRWRGAPFAVQKHVCDDPAGPMRCLAALLLVLSLLTLSACGGDEDGREGATSDKAFEDRAGQLCRRYGITMRRVLGDVSDSVNAEADPARIADVLRTGVEPIAEVADELEALDDSRTDELADAVDETADRLERHADAVERDDQSAMRESGQEMSENSTRIFDIIERLGVDCGNPPS